MRSTSPTTSRPASSTPSRAQENITAKSSQYSGFNYLTFNGGARLTDGSPIPGETGHPSLEDPVVREAIHYAIDKEALVDRTLQGRGIAG